MQPWLTSEWRASASGPIFAGERSSERVWMSQVRSKRSSGGHQPDQVEVGLPVRLDRCRRRASSRRTGGRRRAAPPASMAGITSCPKSLRSADQPGVERGPGEDVDAHRGEVALRLGRLLLPVDDAPVARRGCRSPSATPRPAGTGSTAIVTSAPFALVGRDHRPVVHLVDVVAAQDEHRVGAALVDLVEVVADGVRRAQVPAAGLGRHVRLQELDAQAARPVEAPRTSRADVVVAASAGCTG